MNQMPSVAWGVPLHCDLRPLKTPTGIIRILLVVSIIISLSQEAKIISIFFVFSLFFQIDFVSCVHCL